MLVAEPAHVLELTTIVHSPRISQRHLVDLCCKLSFFFLYLMSLECPSTRSKSQADMMVGTFPTSTFCSQLAPPLCQFPWAALLSSCCPGSSSKVVLPWVPSISDDKQNHPPRCLQQVSPHHPFESGYAIPLNSVKRSIVIASGWYKEFQ